MFTINKSEFGAFVCTLRKEKGMTQKELAGRLFVSDKAVSKWETGQSIPDVSLLIPMAEILGVTVTELLECRRLEKPQEMSANQVEDIVIKAVSYGEKKEKRVHGLNLLPVFAAIVITSAAEIVFINYNMKHSVVVENITVLVALAAFFGMYFFFFVKERLPSYYDENTISAYHDGFLRINIRGVRFNNRNWPHIVKSVKIWTVCTLLTAPAVTFLLMAFMYWLEAVVHIVSPLEGGWEQVASLIIILIYTGTMIVSVVLPAKKYE